MGGWFQKRIYPFISPPPPLLVKWDFHLIFCTFKKKHMSLFDPYVRKCYSPDVPPWLNLSMTGLGNVPSKYQPRESNSQLLILDPKSIVIGPLYILLFFLYSFIFYPTLFHQNRLLHTPPLSRIDSHFLRILRRSTVHRLIR